MTEYNFNAILTTELLVSEVSGGAFAFKNKIRPAAVKLLWEKLSFWIAEVLKSQKGVLLPNLGNFRVGPIIGESKKKIRAQFSLLEGRYGAISQERPKYNIGGKAPIVQPNYGLLSTAAAVHRGAGQRLIAELLQRLGVHILSARSIKVWDGFGKHKIEFPSLGKLVTNRVGRIEFVFDPLFSEYFEREHYAVVKEMPYSPEDYEVQRGLQSVSLGDPPPIKSPRGRASSRPVSAISAVNGKERSQPQGQAPLTGSLKDLLKLCREVDRIASGCIPRLKLEHWLNKECRPILAMVDGATLFGLLDKHSYGKVSPQVMYKPFLTSLDATLAAPPPQQEEPQQPWQWQPPASEEVFEKNEHAAADDDEVSVQDLVVGQSPHVQPELQQDLPVADEGSYLHYCQNQLSPRSRHDYDAFNRAHFERLHSSQGRASKRAVTPKVGEEPLNLSEYQAVRAVTPGGSRAVTPPRGRGGPGQAPSHEPIFGGYGAAASPLPSAVPRPPSGLRPQSQQQHWMHSDPPHQQQAISHQPQVLHVLHPSPLSPTGASEAPHRPQGPGHQQQYDIIAPPPSQPRPPSRPVLPLSQYDIQKEKDPEVRAQLKAEYAAGLTEGWSKQIREKDELSDVLEAKGTSWPFVPVGVPMDKRPISSISRPLTSPRRSVRG